MSVFEIPEKETGDTVSAQEINDIVAATRGFRAYVALLSAFGTSHPDATVMNIGNSNFLGNLVWTRIDVGEYLGTLEGQFVEGKVIGFLTPGSNFCTTLCGMNDNDSFFISVGDIQTGDSADILGSAAIEIRVYQ